jgi:hypothetical protein
LSLFGEFRYIRYNGSNSKPKPHCSAHFPTFCGRQRPLRFCRRGRSCPFPHDPSSTCKDLRGSRCSSAGTCF